MAQGNRRDQRVNQAHRHDFGFDERTDIAAHRKLQIGQRRQRRHDIVNDAENFDPAFFERARNFHRRLRIPFRAEADKHVLFIGGQQLFGQIADAGKDEMDAMQKIAQRKPEEKRDRVRTPQPADVNVAGVADHLNRLLKGLLRRVGFEQGQVGLIRLQNRLQDGL